MPTPRLPEAEIRRVFALVQEAIDKGYPPPGATLRRGEIGAIRRVNDALGRGDACYTLKCVRAADARFGLTLTFPNEQPSAVIIEPSDYEARRAARKGEAGFAPVLAGFAVSQVSTNTETGAAWVKQKPEPGEVFEAPAGHMVKGVSALVDPEGRTLAKWVKTRAEPDTASLIEELDVAFRDFKPAADPRPTPSADFTDQISLYPLSDPHVGLLSWRGDAERNWDLKIGVRTIKKTVDAVIARTPQTKSAILLVGGDTLHADNNSNMTAASGNVLQVDGRYPKILLAACEMLVSIVTSLLDHHESVDAIVLGGNHDEHASFAISFFLNAWFRNEPRVSVDTSAAPIRFRHFGKTFIAATHGHLTKAKDLPAVMAAREPKSWGASVHRFGHLFHVHHASQKISEGGGVITETHQIIAPQDAWHFGAGFVSGRSMQSIVYDKEHGEVGRTKVAVID